MGPQSCALTGFYGNWLVKLGMGGQPAPPYLQLLLFFFFFNQIDPSFMFFLFSFLHCCCWNTGFIFPSSAAHQCPEKLREGTGCVCQWALSVIGVDRLQCVQDLFVFLSHAHMGHQTLPVSDLPCFFKVQNLRFLLSASFMLSLPEIRSRGQRRRLSDP